MDSGIPWHEHPGMTLGIMKQHLNPKLLVPTGAKTYHLTLNADRGVSWEAAVAARAASEQEMADAGRPPTGHAGFWMDKVVKNQGQTGAHVGFARCHGIQRFCSYSLWMLRGGDLPMCPCRLPHGLLHT